MKAGEKWSVFFEYLTNKGKREKINEILDKEEEIAMAGETLIHISRDDIEQARLTTELKNKLDYQSGMVYAERKGRTEGHAEGITEGIAKGRTEGLQEGEQKRSLEIAKNLKAAGVSAEIIFQTTGLRPEE